MSDEAHFHFEGYVNKQNCRIWGSETPKMMIEKPLYPQRVTVWCVFWAGLHYRTMFDGFLWPELEDMNVDDVYFQQDGATCHTSGETTRLLREKFLIGNSKCTAERRQIRRSFRYYPRIALCACYDYLSVSDIVIYFYTFKCGGFLTYDFF